MSIDVEKWFGTKHSGTGIFTASGEYDMVNSYASVTAMGGNAIIIDTANAKNGLFNWTDAALPFQVMVHISALKNTNADKSLLGCFIVANVIERNGDALTLDRDISYFATGYILTDYVIQAVLVGGILQLTGESGANIQPPVFDFDKGYGGILFIKSSQWMRLNEGASVTAKDKGIPASLLANASISDYSSYSEDSIKKAAGWNNSLMFSYHILNGFNVPRFPLQVGDGNIIIQTERLFLRDDVFIGRKLGDAAEDNEYTCANRGGAKIMLFVDENIREDNKGNIYKDYWSIAETIHTNRPDAIDGADVGGCIYIGAENRSSDNIFYTKSLKAAGNNEGKLSYNVAANTFFIREKLGLRDYLGGELGSARDLTENLNNYAKVTAISEDGYKITYENKTSDGIAKFRIGAYVLFLVSQWGEELDQDLNNAHPEYDLIGKFKICRILSDDGYSVVLDRKPPEFEQIKEWLNSLSIQLVTIACFTDVTQTIAYHAMRPFRNGIGGVLAIACSGILDLSSGGRLLTVTPDENTSEPHGIEYGIHGLRYIGNAQDRDKLPVGTGHGSAFVMAKTLNLSRTSRIGADYDGAWTGGCAQQETTAVYPAGGYMGLPFDGGGGGGNPKVQSSIPPGWIAGGYGGNGRQTDYGKTLNQSNNNNSNQGAHIMCIADTIQNFTISAFSTGGGTPFYREYNYNQNLIKASLDLGSGGAGYGAGASMFGNSSNGGSGGYNGGGSYINEGNGSSGGSSGWCFIYVNHVDNVDNRGIVVSQSADVLARGGETPDLQIVIDEQVYKYFGLSEEEWTAKPEVEKEEMRTQYENKVLTDRWAEDSKYYEWANIPVKGWNAMSDAERQDVRDAYETSKYIQSIPVGTILPYSGNVVPDKFLACNGAAVSRTTYQELFDVIGTTYGAGDGTTTFNLPLIEDNRFMEFSNTAGTAKEAGLPDVAGWIRTNVHMNGGGAFVTYANANVGYNYSSETVNNTMAFALSFGNAIYGKSDTVQPKSLTVRAIIKY